MANKVYPKAIEAALKGAMPDLSSAGTNVKALLVDTSAYTYSNAHEFLSDIPSGARIATSGNLANKSIATVNTDDVRFDADDYSITIGASQPSVEALVYYVDTGNAATSRLLCYKDTGLSWLPRTPPTGGEVLNVTVNASGVFEWQNP